MKVLVVGCGSIGSRRAKILAELGHDVRIWDRREDVMMGLAREGPHHMLVCKSLEVALEVEGGPEAVLICTPPEAHLEGALEAATAYGVRGLYVEKPLTLDLDELPAFSTIGRPMIWSTGPVPKDWSKPLVTMGACNMRFDERASQLDGIFPESGFFTMGQAARHWSRGHFPLPMLLDSIHELDLATWLFGPIVRIEGTQSRDYADVLVTHKDGVSHISLNRVADPPYRGIRLHVGEQCYETDLWPPDMEMYRREMEHFMDCVETGEETMNPLREAAETTKRALEVPCG